MTRSSQFGQRLTKPQTNRTQSTPWRMLLQRRRLRRLLARSSDVVALQLAIKGGAADAEHLAGQSLVSIHLRKNALDGCALDIFQVSSAVVSNEGGYIWRIH